MNQFLQKYDDSYHGENHSARENDALSPLIFSWCLDPGVKAKSDVSIGRD